MERIDYQQALLDPTRVFADRAAVLSASGLTAEQKQEILKRWDESARQGSRIGDADVGQREAKREAEAEESLASLKRAEQEPT